MAPVAIPPVVIERIVEVLEPEEVWLFGSRARRAVPGPGEFPAGGHDTLRGLLAGSALG